MWWKPSTWQITDEDPLWLTMLHQILTASAGRNDFESHGYNLYVWLLLGAAFVMAVWSSFFAGMVAAIPAALAGLYIREIVIDKRHADPVDIVSGMLFIILAVLTAVAIKNAALAPYMDLIEREEAIRQLITDGVLK